MARIISLIFLLLSCISANSYDLSRVLIDLSSNNSNLEVSEYLHKEEKILAIMHRATLGTYEKASDFDSLFSQRAKEAHESGLLFGAYHLPFPSSDAKRQTMDFLEQTNERCIPGQKLLLAIDWEDAKGKNGKVYKVDAQRIADMIKYINNITGANTILYTNPGYLKNARNHEDDLNMFDEIHITNLSDAKTPLWIAQYYRKYTTSTESYEQFGFIIPNSDTVAPFSEWSFWQFSEGKGPHFSKRTDVRLRNEPVDLNFFNGTREQFIQFHNDNSWTCGELPTRDEMEKQIDLLGPAIVDVD